jgi:hypothetical protein
VVGACSVDGELASTWRVIGRSVRGATHVRSGAPNQDAIDWQPKSGGGLPLILALSDGHGSAKSFRSERGSHIAVKTAIAALKDFVSGQTEASVSFFKRTAEEMLPQELVRRWKEEVGADSRREALSGVELDLLEEKEGKAARQEVMANPFLPYGATLLVAVVAESFLLYLQLGDGDILTVSPEGEVFRPLPADNRLFANVTTSLCSEKSWRDFRVGFHVRLEDSPGLILVSTDGCSNSFRDEASFLKVGTDLLGMIRTEGLKEVDESLEDWLTETSQSGSGDDISLGIICHTGTWGE